MTARRLLAALGILACASAGVASTLTTSGPLYWDTANWNNANTTSLLIDATGEKVAFVFQAPKTGSIRKLYARLGTVTEEDTLRFSLQDVDGTTGAPDGTADQSCTVTFADTDDNTWQNCTLGSDRSVTRGDYLSFVVDYNSYADGNLNIIVASNIVVASTYVLHYTTSWSIQSRGAIFYAEYSDGSSAAIPGAFPAILTTSDISNATTPDELCNIVNVPAAVSVGGATVYINTGTGDFDVVLYDTDGTTALKTLVTDQTIRQGAGLLVYWFASDADLTASADYRLCVKPSSATTTRVTIDQAPAAGALNQLPFGSAMHRSQRTDAGAWSQTTTDRVRIWPIITKVHDGTGGGGGVMTHPGMQGGPRGSLERERQRESMPWWPAPRPPQWYVREEELMEVAA